MQLRPRALKVEENFQLKSRDTVLGNLKLASIDQPFFRCAFTATDQWEEFRPLFVRQAAAVDEGTPEEVSQAVKAVRDLELKIVPLDREGPAIVPTLVQVRGDEAIFRY